MVSGFAGVPEFYAKTLYIHIGYVLWSNTVSADQEASPSCLDFVALESSVQASEDKRSSTDSPSCVPCEVQ